MKQRELNRLNGILCDRLGVIISERGELPGFCWMRTTEVFYFHAGGVSVRDSPGRLIALVEPRYERISEASKYGNCWCIAGWHKTEMTKAQWESSFEGEFPYPEKGMYYLIDGAVLPEGVSPDEKLTYLFVDAINRQLESSMAELVNAAKAAGQAPVDAKRKAFHERVDDFWPAFDNERAREDRLGQSRGGHVSFGGS